MLTFFRSILVINAIAGFFPLDASSQLYSEAGGSVVKIHIFGTLKKASESGSIDFEEFGTGFYATPDGLILTAGHLIPDRSERCSELKLRMHHFHDHWPCVKAERSRKKLGS